VLDDRFYQCYNIKEQGRNFGKRRKTDVGPRPSLRNTDPKKTETATRPPHLRSFEQPKLCRGHFHSRVKIATNYGAFFFCGATAQIRPRPLRFEVFRSNTIRHKQPVGLLITSDQHFTEAAGYTRPTQDTNNHVLSGIRTRDPSNLMPWTASPPVMCGAC